MEIPNADRQSRSFTWDSDGDADDYVPRNMPAIGDLFDMFNFRGDGDDHGDR